MNGRQSKIAILCDGILTSKEIALLTGDNQKYIQKTMLAFDLPRVKQGASTGEKNPSWIGGRSVDLDGYVQTPTPAGFHGRKIGRISEHRLVMAKKIGRNLETQEVVDHIDGLRLHNHPSNLRLFSCNADHLKLTITGQTPKWSSIGMDRMRLPHSQRKGLMPVDTYHQRKERGEIRVEQILLAALSLGIDNHFLSGTLHHLEKIQIDFSSPTRIRQALDSLYQQWSLAH